jgi:hypothetical protein
MKEPQSKEGIISYLTEVHGTYVHEKDTVPMRVLSLPEAGLPQTHHLQTLADLTCQYRYREARDGRVDLVGFPRNAPPPDEVPKPRLRPYSWALEGSMDGENWTERDRQASEEH